MNLYATINVRVPPELAAWLKQTASTNGRSLNAEIVAALTVAREKAPSSTPKQ